ncbi:MAG: hypothetical protein ACLFUS_04195 [Candidatus Sumerlaeia bacterium]
MKKLIVLAMVMTLLAGLMVGCGGKKVDPKASAAPDEELVWSSSDKRPGWTLKAPDDSDGNMYFIGRSGRLATEQLAHRRAMMDARTQITQNMGTLVKNKIEQARVDFGLSSDVVNPTESAREYTKQLAANYVSGAKDKDTYVERWKTPTGYGWQYWVLVAMPKNLANESSSEFAAAQARENMRKAKQESDAIAKEQLEKASDMWKKIQEEGLAE